MATFDAPGSKRLTWGLSAILEYSSKKTNFSLVLQLKQMWHAGGGFGGNIYKTVAFISCTLMMPLGGSAVFCVLLVFFLLSKILFFKNSKEIFVCLIVDTFYFSKLRDNIMLCKETEGCRVRKALDLHHCLLEYWKKFGILPKNLSQPQVHCKCLVSVQRGKAPDSFCDP